MGKPHSIAGSHEGYHDFESEDGKYGHFEVFWFECWDDKESGWYWHPCFPGCLADGDAVGPFLTSRAAYKDAQGRA